jgi:hypothetical protein
VFVRRLLGALPAGAFALVLLAQPAGAATVVNTSDSGPGSLRQAIADAAVGETIAVPAGEYRLTSGELVISKSLTLAGAGAGSTVLESRGNFRLIRVTGAGSEVTISGMTIRGGHQFSNPALGGGILDEGAKLTLREATVFNNVAASVGSTEEARGGGVAATGGGTLALIRTDVSENEAAAAALDGEHGGRGGGGGVASIDSTLTVLGSTIVRNRASGPGGRGAPDPGQTGGFAGGGGIWTSGGSISVTASAITENSTQTLPGPGAAPGSGINEGGGIVIRASPASIVSSTIDGNRIRGGIVAMGGGVFIGTGGVRLLGDTITDNVVDSVGPQTVGGNLSVSSVLFGDATTVAGTIVSGGVAPLATGNCDAPVRSLGFNLESDNQCGFNAVTDRPLKDPQLGPLKDNGDPTPTRMPSRTSPAVDAGASFGLLADQRELARPVDFLAILNPAGPGGDGADIGAVELQPAPELRLGKLTRRRSGIALLAVTVPEPVAGTLTLSGAGLKTVSTAVAGETATLKVQTTGKARRALRLRGRRRVQIQVTYTPSAGAPVSAVRKAVLIQRRKPHKAHKRRGHPKKGVQG